MPNGSTRTARTDRSGNYLATNLTVGTYTIYVSAPGFKEYTADNVTFFAAQEMTVNAPLEPGAANESVTVQSYPVAVKTESNAQAGTISGTRVRELELSNRDFERLVTLQPGVVSGLGDKVAFHGDVYDFFRNNVLNANTFFGHQTDTPRGIERYNDFGFTLGRPLYIPRVYNTGKNKTFFFWSEEWPKESVPTVGSQPAPTQAQLNGVVTGQVVNAPAGRVTYNAALNQSTIHPNCYNRNSAVYLANVFDKFAANNDGSYQLHILHSITFARIWCVSTSIFLLSFASSGAPSRMKCHRTFLWASLTARQTIR